MNFVTKSIRLLRDEGLFRFLKKAVIFVYDNHLVPFLPRRTAVYNGVEVNAARLFDAVLPWRTKNRPCYESGLISSIKNHVRKSDNVVIVGGGWGVTAVIAAQRVGTSGKVTVFEGSLGEVQKVKETALRNSVLNTITINHAIVGPLVSLRGKEGNASRISPDDLPDCDVLELDCEGSELDILENLGIRPRVILIESHGHHDAPSAEVKENLADLSYSIKSEEVADEGLAEFCTENDVYSITAVRE